VSGRDVAAHHYPTLQTKDVGKTAKEEDVPTLLANLIEIRNNQKEIE
jgi:uncharacterized protein with HEPN domain